MSTDQQTIYRFGDFRLDARRRLLLSADNDQPVPLTPKPFDLLLYLVEHADDLIPKQQLLDNVWPNVIVEENNLTQAISTLRRALGERPEEHRYIATVPGRGYRFVAEVQSEIQPAGGAGPLSAKSQRESPGQPTQPTSPAPMLYAGKWIRPWMPKIFFAAVAGAVLVVAAIYLHRMGTGSGQQTGARSYQVTSTELVLSAGGNHTQPSLSPDGSRVAFVNDVTGTSQIYVKNLASGAPIQITYGDIGASSPSWSPRDDRIIYQLSGHGIWSIDPMGTLNPRRIIEEGTNPSMSWDGTQIVYELADEIRLANADGSGQRPVAGAPSGDRMFASAHPSLSPDGTEIVLFQQAVGPIGDYWIVPTEVAQARRLTFDLQWGGKAAWTPDGQIVFPSKRGGTLTLWRVPAAGGEPETITTGLGADRYPVISRNGQKLIYETTRYESFFVVTDPETGLEEVIYSNRRLIAFPRVSPDARWVVFFAEVEPRQQIMLMKLDGSDVQQLTEYRSDEANIMPRWSPDGRSIYYYQNIPPATFRKLDLAGGPSKVVIAEFDWHRNMDAEISPLGRHIAFVKSNGDGSNRRVVIRELESGQETPLGPGIMFAPSWSKDGRYVLGTAPHRVLICPVSGSECSIIADSSELDPPADRGGALGHYAQWSWDESRVFFARRTATSLMLGLWVVDRDGSNLRQLFQFGPVHPLEGRFQVLPDDRILWVRYQQGRSELVLATLSHSDN